MPLCFIEPQNAIRVIAESVGREARRQLLGEVVKAWVDEIPEPELEAHYAKAVADLDEHDLSMLAAWHASLEVGHPVPNKEFLVNVFQSLGLRRDSHALESDLVDPRLRFARADECRVHDHVEDLVDRELRAPELLPLTDVVGADRHPIPAAAELPHVLDHPLVRMQVVEIALSEPVELDRPAELVGELFAESVKKAGLGHPPGLELEQW